MFGFVTVLIAHSPAFAQTWILVTNAPSAGIIASSADGTKLVAAGNLIYASTDSGANWTTSAAPNANWSSVASSADGSHLVAAALYFGSGANPGLVYTSTNSGVSWIATPLLNTFWQAVASSADGTKLVAANEGQIYTSTDGGTTWTLTSAPGQWWSCLASSADGTKLAAAAIYGFLGAGGQIYTSTNAGANWTVSSAPNEEWYSIASSADGSKLVAAANHDRNTGQPGQLYISFNYGAAWQTVTYSLPTAYWSSVACSADGSRLIAVANSDTNYNASPIYVSADGGWSWRPAIAPGQHWSAVASSADGCNLVALGYSGPPANESFLYTFTCSGPPWKATRIHYQRLKSFQLPPGQLGGRPQTALLEGADKALYGTAFFGSTGMIFKLSKDGSGFSELYPINSPAGLAEGSDGALYGTSSSGGRSNLGTIFKLNKDGSSFGIVHNFDADSGGGYDPEATLIQASDGVLYGTTHFGGSNYVGTVFKLNRDGSGYGLLASLGNTCCPFGLYDSRLIEGRDGLLYGTTTGNRSNDWGSVFTLNKDGTFYQILYAPRPNYLAPGDGWSPNALLEGSDGVLYGTTLSGGAFDKGTLFRINKDGTGYGLLLGFSSPGAPTYFGGEQCGLIEGADRALYGTTANGGTNDLGTVFRVNKDGTGFAVLYSFGGTAGDGESPLPALLEGSDGAFYGTTTAGGDFGLGTVFRIWPPQTPDHLVIKPAGGVQVSFSGLSDYRYQILRSTDLTNWVALQTITMPASGIYINLDSNPPSRAAYYRAAWIP